MYWALYATDEYAWVWNEYPICWFPVADSTQKWWREVVHKKEEFISKRVQPLGLSPGMTEAVESARRKIAENKPLGFDLTPLMNEIRDKREAELKRDLFKRSANIHKVPAGDERPRIDGRLDDPVWKQTKPLAALRPSAGANREKTEAATICRVTYDQEFLYVAFHCREPEMDKLRIVGDQRDSDVYNGDAVEVLVSVSEEASEYRHFIVNPKNVQWDGKAPPPSNDRLWDAEWSSAVQREKEAWTVEMAIPWNVLGGRPEPGSQRYVNLCRNRRPVGELSSWSPVTGSFQDPERFGTWVFE